jgi:tetratricopeptide (TPR) repeat protein
MMLFYTNNIFAGETTKQIINESKKSVVFISIQGGNGKERAQATGFFLGNNGYIVTNFHVIYDAANISVKTDDGKIYWIKDVIGSDVESDIAVFTVQGVPSIRFPLKLAAAAPEQGDEVIVIGNPEGLEETVSTGIISALRKLPDIGQVYQTTAPVSPGSSGSPVINSAGEVIGAAALQYKEGQNLNFVVPFTVINKILAAKRPTPFRAWKKSGIGYMPGNADATTKLGFMYFASDKYNEAEVCAFNAIRVDPKNAKAYYLAGIAAFKLKNTENALSYMKKAISLDTTIEYLHNDLGLMYHKMGNDGPATEEFFNEIEKHPENQSPYCNLAEIYEAGGTPDDALEILKRGLVNCDETADIHAMLGLVYSNEDQMTDAMSEEKTALNLDETCAEAYYGMGVISVKNGDRDGALKAFLKLKKLDADLAAELAKIIYR